MILMVHRAAGIGFGFCPCPRKPLEHFLPTGHLLRAAVKDFGNGILFCLAAARKLLRLLVFWGTWEAGRDEKWLFLEDGEEGEGGVKFENWSLL